MLRHYFTSTIPNIKKNKLSFAINIIGLSLGLASAFIISSYVLKETSYDRFHTKKDRIFRVLCDNQNVNWTSPNVPYILKENIDKSIPNVERSCLINYLYMARVKQGEEYFRFRGMHAATPEFFEIFDYELISGNIENALRHNNSIVLIESIAKKYFPKEDPIGKTLEININNKILQLTVDAVIKDFPKNSSFKFNALCNFNLAIRNFEAMPWASEFRTSWGINFSKMFVLLKDKESESFQTSWDQIESELNLKEKEVHYHLQKLVDVHLDSDHLVNDGSRGNKTYIYLFSAIALIILMVAAFNYIILSISVSKLRYKEIGVKKILGSHNKIIRKQFFVESILVSLVAFPIAYLLAFWTVGYLNKLFNISLEINVFNDFNQLFAFIILLILNGFIAGSYIAFYLSRLNPVQILKFKFINQNRKIRFQYLMLAFQIIVFTGLTGASFSIYKQIDFIKKADLGIDLSNKISVYLDDMEVNHASYQTISNVLSNIPEVKDFIFGIYLPPENSRSVMSAPDPNDETKKIQYEEGSVSKRFFEFFKIQCVQGRLFELNFKDDSNKIIVNETFVNTFGFEEPIGKSVNDKEIIGVVKDFNNHSLHEDIPPMAFSLVLPKYVFEIGIEYQEGLAQECAEKVKYELSELNPEASFETVFIENKIEDLYSEEHNLNNIIIYFSLFAIIIALIGIFGQSLFAVKQQVKEIGIRKVNGATGKDILLFVIKKYTLICLIANLISWPIVYYFIDSWQERFVYKSPINVWLIITTLTLSTIIVLSTVISNAWKATLTDPVKVLKYE